MVVTVTHGGYIKRVPLSTYRAQRRGGKGRSGMATARRGFRHPPVRRQHPHAGAVLLLARAGLQGEGLAPAARRRRRRAARRWSTCCRSSRASASPHHAAAGGRGELGRARRDVRHHARHRAAQQAVATSSQVNRNGKIAMKLDEGDAHRRRRRSAPSDDDVLLTTAQRPVHPLPGRRRARVQGPRFDRRARHQARPRATASSRWRSCAMSRRPPTSAPPISSMRRAVAGEPANGRGRRREPATTRRRGRRRDVALSHGALCRDGRGRAVHPDRLRERLRQAHLVLRVPHHRPRRQRHRRHGRQQPQRPAGRLLPGRGRATRSCWSPTAAS